MRFFLYYIPGNKTGVSTDKSFDRVIRETGLEYLRDTTPRTGHVENNGPDGGAGCIFWCMPKGRQVKETDNRRLGYYADKQTWRPHPDGKYWIGWYTDAPPGPDDLRRPEFIAGTPERLGDGNEWVFPLGYSILPDGYASNIPSTLGLDDKGNDRHEPLPYYSGLAALCDEALEQIMQFEADRTYRFAYDFLYRVTFGALAINYRLDVFAAKALRLFINDDRAVTRALHCVGYEAAVAALKAQADPKGVDADTDDAKKNGHEENASSQNTDAGNPAEAREPVTATS